MHNLYPKLAPHLLAIIEFLLLASAAALIFLSSRSSASREKPAAFLSLQSTFARLARRKRLSTLLMGIGVVAIRVALVPVLGVPQPRFNDEFSYLLAADTFAHGRITNPTHPMWIHFESFHIIEKPTYMAMYPPAQGLVLAAGQLLGHPWIGQLFITAAMCSALCWMLQGWLPPPWAFLGSTLAVLRLGLLSYWMNTYWCASVAALGGALVLGAWPRLRKHLRIRDSLLLALGVAILANSRPYEGLVFVIPVAAAMLFWLTRSGQVGSEHPESNHSGPNQNSNHPDFSQSFRRVILPISIVLLVVGMATGYYNHCVTGDAFRMAYQVNRDTYATAPYFIWQTPRPEPVYHHAVMRDFYRWELGEFKANRTFSGYTRRGAEKIFSWWQFYLGPLLTLPLLALPGIVRQCKMHLPLLICVAMIIGFSAQTWTLPHYFSPATGALYLLLVQGIRHLWLWKRDRRRTVGPALVRMIPVIACAMILLRMAAVLTHTNIEPARPRGNLERAKMLARLQQQPGPQLVIVRYEPHHDVDREWVYNDADIDYSKVVWARDMGSVDNLELLRFFRGRTAWLVEPDSNPPQLMPYPE
jgi:hypothetical protein